MNWKLSKSTLVIVGFGFALAILLVMLNFFKFKFLVGDLSAEIYTLIVAGFFTILGIYIAKQLFPRKGNITNQKEVILTSPMEKINLRVRELEILQLIAKGHTNQEIADHLHLALPTIKTHVSNMYAKLEVKNRTQAIIRAQKLRIL